MKKTILLSVLAALCLNFPVFAQNKNVITALKIGDQVPNITLTDLLNYKTADGNPSTVAKLADFKGKLLILDFWATWCTACLENFPKMEALQKKFTGRIKIIAITTQNKSLVQKFLASHRQPDGQPHHLITVVNDHVFSKMFPHHGIPHVVWIDGQCKVAAITGAEEVTEKNIGEILAGTGPEVKEKIDIDIARPLFLSSDYPSYNHLYHYSLLSKSANPGLPSGTRLRVKGDTVYGRVITNSSILQLYEAAARQLFKADGGHYSSKQLILEVKDSLKVSARTKDGLYDLENQFSYDLIVPITEADSLYGYMMQDLNRYSGYTGKIEHRKVRCYTLSRTTAADNLKTAGGPVMNTLFYEKPALLNNCPMAFLVNELNYLKEISLPVVDDTDYANNVDIRLSGSRDLASINHDLAAYGLQLKETERTIPMLVLADKPARASRSAAKTQFETLLPSNEK